MTHLQYEADNFLFFMNNNWTYFRFILRNVNTVFTNGGKKSWYQQKKIHRICILSICNCKLKHLFSRLPRTKPIDNNDTTFIGIDRLQHFKSEKKNVQFIRRAIYFNVQLLTSTLISIYYFKFANWMLFHRLRCIFFF